MQEYPKICIMGLGYIGLPTASLLATKNFEVQGVDVQEKVVQKLNQGEIHIVEPDLDILVRAAVHSGKFKASTSPCKADIFILAVPTPFNADKSPDLSYVQAAAAHISSYLEEGNLVILESTSPVGTTEMVGALIREKRPELKKIHFAYCPERVIPGHILKELVENDRIVGGLDQASTERAVTFYESFVLGEVLATDARTAEMCKLTENSFRDVNIAFANELSMICDQLKINVWELIRLANHHPRVKVLQPGPGVGGHCIAIDPWFIVASAPKLARLIRTAREVNDSKPEWVLNQVRAAAKKFSQPVIACLGVTFKADIDDLRESPALHIAQQLSTEQIGKVVVCEPHASELPGLILIDLEQAIKQADIILILVDHKPFKALKREQLQDKVVIDTKGILVSA